jgi:WD40-like Beta Propeller Repeat
LQAGGHRFDPGHVHQLNFRSLNHLRCIAFAAKSKRVRVWLLPFDSNAGRVLGTGSPVTSLGYQAYEPSLSPDGMKLAYAVLRGGRWEIWGKLLPDGQESPLITGDYDFEFPQWPRDGKQLVCRRTRSLSGPPEVQFALWSEQTRTEEQLTRDHWAPPMTGGSTTVPCWSLLLTRAMEVRKCGGPTTVVGKGAASRGIRSNNRLTARLKSVASAHFA